MQDKYSYYIYNIINYEKQVTLVYIASQNKASKMVSDISVSGTKLHISYSDGTSKDMDMPPATSIRLPVHDKNPGGWWYNESKNDYFSLDRLAVDRFGAILQGTWYFNQSTGNVGGSKSVTFRGDW